MKKNLLYGAMIALCAGCLASCSDDDDDPVIIDPAEGYDFFVLNQGSYYDQIEGSLTGVNTYTGTATQRLFQTANGRSIGSTPQTAIAYGSHIYIGVYESNTIEVVNRETLKSEKQISLASETGQMPRSIVANGSKLYISMYNGYVCRLDAASLAIDATVQVGPNPEIMAIRGNYLYVPNSDGMNYPSYGTTASKINLSTFTVEKTFEVGTNPTSFVSNGTDLFVLCMGDYDTIMSTIYKVGSDDSVTQIAEGTHMAIDGTTLYICNWPWWESAGAYSTYSTASGALSTWTPSKDVDSIAGIAANDGEVYISSYSLDGGYASYTIDGYVNRYTSDGNLASSYAAGVGPCCIFFN